MQYENIREAKFISRPNRFIADVEISGQEEICHVKIPADAKNCCFRMPMFWFKRSAASGARQNMT